MPVLPYFSYIDSNLLRRSEVDPELRDRLLRWDPDSGEGVWNATRETELSG